MKAIVYDKYGLPEVLRVDDIEKPVPGDGEVLIKIQASSINSWDWDNLTGTPFEYRFMTGILKPKNRKLSGRDIAGTIEQVGNNVTQFTVGDNVFGDLAENGWGAFAEYICVPANTMTIKPDNMTFKEAACISHGGNLAVQGLIDAGHIQSGQKVLINGGGGSTGTLAIQIAKSFGVELTATDNTAKLKTMLELGADHVIDYTKEDFTKDGKKYDLIFDVKTNRSIFHYLRVLNPGGTYVTVGGKTSRILQLSFIKKFLKKYQLHLVIYKPNKDLDYLVQLFKADKLKPIIDKCFPLEKTAEAFRYFGEGKFKGKVVVTMNNINQE